MTLPELFCPRPRARHSPLSGQRPARGSRAAALPASAELHGPGPACPTAGPPHEMLADPSIPAEAPGMLKEPLPGRTQNTRSVRH